jgi:hypothetical protein
LSGGEGRWIEIVLWTDDADAAVNALVATGAPLFSPAHDFLDGRLRAAWIADPDGNPIQLVQRKGLNGGRMIVDRRSGAGLSYIIGNLSAQIGQSTPWLRQAAT